MENNYRILMVHNFYQIPGGEDSVFKNEKKLLEKHGHKVVLYTRHNNELENYSIFNKLLLPITTVFNFKTYNDVISIIKKEKIDIVHVHNTLNLVSPSVYYAAVKCGIPVVQTIHNFRMLCPGANLYRDGQICEDCLKYGLKCSIKHKCYRNNKIHTLACVITTKIHRLLGIYKKINYICLTEFNKRKLLQLNEVSKKMVVDPEKVYVKPNFVNDSICPIIPASNRKQQFIYVGRLEELKGTDILLKAWKKLGESSYKLLLCGTGPMEKWCREYISDNNLNAELIGYIDNNDVRKLIAESRALILPTQCYEGFPMTIVEAYSVGTPVITGNIGNSSDLVIDKTTGRLFEYNSDYDLSKKIKDIVDCQQEFYGENAYSVFKKELSSENNYLRLIEIYENIKKA